MTQYFIAAADLLGLPRPPQIAMAEAQRVMTPLMLSYLTETRRMDEDGLADLVTWVKQQAAIDHVEQARSDLQARGLIRA